MDLSGFLRYWSLTLAVFIFYLFAMLVASLDIFSDLIEAARKKRAGSKASALDPNPLVNRTVAETMLSGPGQRLDTKREWVAGLAKDVARRLNVPVQTTVLEDSKGHPLVHFNDRKRVHTYRVDRTLVETAMAGDTAKVAEVMEWLTRHLTADFLGKEEGRPARTTELAREAASKSAPAAGARPAGQAPAATGEDEAAQTATAAPGGASAQPAGPAPPPASTPAAPAAGQELSREERLAAARAKAEELKARAKQQKPPTS